MVHEIAVTIRTDVAVVKEDFPFFDAGVTVLQVHSPIAQRFHLGTLQDHPGLELFLDKVVVISLSIRGYDFILIFCLFGHGRKQRLDLVLGYRL
jgi:hypothetical protein